MLNAAFWKASKKVKPAHTVRVFAAAMYNPKRDPKNQKKHINNKQIPFPKPSRICPGSGFSLNSRAVFGGITQRFPDYQKRLIPVQLCYLIACSSEPDDGKRFPLADEPVCQKTCSRRSHFEEMHSEVNPCCNLPFFRFFCCLPLSCRIERIEILQIHLRAVSFWKQSAGVSSDMELQEA